MHVLKSDTSATSGDWYRIYRRSIVERHVASNGRFMQYVWLAEGPDEPAADHLFAGNRRASREVVLDTKIPIEYHGYPAILGHPDDKDAWIAGGGDNPLLEGGLFMAALAMEDLNGIGANSYTYARHLLDFCLESEWIKDGTRTGLLTRRRHHWWHLGHASTDELSGCLLGLMLLHRAASKRVDLATVLEIESLLRRIARFLRDHGYVYAPPEGSTAASGELIHRAPGTALAFVYLYPFAKLFEAILGDPHFPTRLPEGLRKLVERSVGSPLQIERSVLAMLTNKAISEPTAFEAYRLVLSMVTPTTEALGWGNFFNVAMTCHTIVMVMLSSNVGRAAKMGVARSATGMLLGLMRHPEQRGHDNQYFAVVARLCRQHLTPSVVDAAESLAELTPSRVDDLTVRGAAASLRSICRRLHRGAAATGVWAVRKRKECSAYRDQKVEECKRGYYEDKLTCEKEGYETTRKCASWGFLSGLCVLWSSFKQLVCLVWSAVKQWVCTEWHTLVKRLCIAWTWVVTVVVTAATRALEPLVCFTDREWDDRIREALRPLLDPDGTWFRDLPLGAIQEELARDLVGDFVHTNARGDLLVGEGFTWEHVDPEHSFTRNPPWPRWKAYRTLGPINEGMADTDAIDIRNYVTPGERYQIKPRLGFRIEASGVDFVYPRMLHAYSIRGAVNPELPPGEELFVSLPLPGASIATPKQVLT